MGNSIVFCAERLMSKKKESWATKFAEFPDSANEKTFEVLLTEMVELVFGYSYKNEEIKYQENYTDILWLYQ